MGYNMLYARVSCVVLFKLFLQALKLTNMFISQEKSWPGLLYLNVSASLRLMELEFLSTSTNNTIHSPTHTPSKLLLSFLPLALALARPRTLPSGNGTAHGPAKVNKPGPGTYKGRERVSGTQREAKEQVATTRSGLKMRESCVCPGVCLYKTALM